MIKRKLINASVILGLGYLVVFGLPLMAEGQYGTGTGPTVETKVKVDNTPTLIATLVDKDKKAQKKSATVEVTVTGIKLIDPALASEKPVAGQGHLHYQVDDGYIIATPAAKLSFHGLSPGAHKIVVMLAGNDHAPLGPQATLNLTVP